MAIIAQMFTLIQIISWNSACKKHGFGVIEWFIISGQVFEFFLYIYFMGIAYRWTIIKRFEM